MSSVVISGDTSGTITLQAPAVSGSTTLTLPATTATLATLTTPSFATTIGVGGATASASGSGISFPATQSASSDANTLDDYEEGSWTPACNFAGTSCTVDSISARYVKIGRQVICSANFRITAKGAGSGNFELTGLPFACSSSSYNFGNCQGDTVSLGTASSMMPYIPNATSVSRVLYQSPTSHSDITNTNVNTNCSMYFMLVYTTAT